MSADLFTELATQALGLPGPIQPSLPALFAPESPNLSDALAAEDDRVVSPNVQAERSTGQPGDRQAPDLVTAGPDSQSDDRIQEVIRWIERPRPQSPLIPSPISRDPLLGGNELFQAKPGTHPQEGMEASGQSHGERLGPPAAEFDRANPVPEQAPRIDLFQRQSPARVDDPHLQSMPEPRAQSQPAGTYPPAEPASGTYRAPENASEVGPAREQPGLVDPSHSAIKTNQAVPPPSNANFTGRSPMDLSELENQAGDRPFQVKRAETGPVNTPAQPASLPVKASISVVSQAQYDHPARLADRPVDSNGLKAANAMSDAHPQGLPAIEIASLRSDASSVSQVSETVNTVPQVPAENAPLPAFQTPVVHPASPRERWQPKRHASRAGQAISRQPDASRAEGMAGPGDEAPSVRISIGRVVVRGQPAPQVHQDKTASDNPVSPALSLNDYLKRRQGRSQ